MSRNGRRQYPVQEGWNWGCLWMLLAIIIVWSFVIYTAVKYL